MSTNAPIPPVSPQPPKKARWLLYGCGTLVALLLVIVATVALTLWWIQRPIKPVVLSPKEKARVEAKLRELESTNLPPPAVSGSGRTALAPTPAPAPERGSRNVELPPAVAAGAPLPPKPIVLTFDDGYDDNYLNAFPTLKDHGFTGAFFVITVRADSSAFGYMTWEQIQEMAANGMEIGSHSLDHRCARGAKIFARIDLLRIGVQRGAHAGSESLAELCRDVDFTQAQFDTLRDVIVGHAG